MSASSFWSIAYISGARQPVTIFRRNLPTSFIIHLHASKTLVWKMVTTRTARILLGVEGLIFGALSTVFLLVPNRVNGTNGQLAGAPTSIVRDLG
jgi:hypothetical protein